MNHLKKEIVTALSGFDGDAPHLMDDLKIMDKTGMELVDKSQQQQGGGGDQRDNTFDFQNLVNGQELHVVFRISDDEYEPVQIEYADTSD